MSDGHEWVHTRTDVNEVTLMEHSFHQCKYHEVGCPARKKYSRIIDDEEEYCLETSGLHCHPPGLVDSLDKVQPFALSMFTSRSHYTGPIDEDSWETESVTSSVDCEGERFNPRTGVLWRVKCKSHEGPCIPIPPQNPSPNSKKMILRCGRDLECGVFIERDRVNNKDVVHSFTLARQAVDAPMKNFPRKRKMRSDDPDMHTTVVRMRVIDGKEVVVPPEKRRKL